MKSTFAALAILAACLLSGCTRTLTIQKDDFTATYTNTGFDTSIGTLKIDRLPDGSISIEAGDLNSEAGLARSIAEGVAAGLKR